MSDTTHEHDYEAGKKEVWKIFWLLLVVTVVEVGLALIWSKTGLPRMLLNLLFIILSLAKAIYIVGVFMHMKYENKSLKLTVLVPVAFLIWAIIAFLWEGGYYGWSRIHL